MHDELFDPSTMQREESTTHNLRNSRRNQSKRKAGAGSREPWLMHIVKARAMQAFQYKLRSSKLILCWQVLKRRIPSLLPCCPSLLSCLRNTLPGGWTHGTATTDLFRGGFCCLLTPRCPAGLHHRRQSSPASGG
jgi:hypothetical protein